MKVTAVILGCCLVHLASTQCLTDNDDVDKPASTDLIGITDFAITLFKELFPHQESKNIFFSPYSIWSALTLAYFGSEGNTKLQLRSALGVGNKVETLMKWRALEFMYRMRMVNNSNYTFNLANRAYFDRSVTLNKCVHDILSNELQVVNMSENVAVSQEINEWVSNVTKGRITDLVSPADLANSNMVLTNAAYFKGTWLYEFNKNATKKMPFYSSTQNNTLVDMMVQKSKFRFGKSEELGAHILELPYTGESISMLLLLPPFITGDKGFESMMSRLNSTTLKNARDNMWRNEVEVIIPKFKLEETIGNELMEALVRMGVRDLFDSSTANLTFFSPNGQLSVGKSIHKAFVEVTEEGTEAAAATAFMAYRMRPAEPSRFECNHPFLFIIYDNLTNNVLFMGAYKEPKK